MNNNNNNKNNSNNNCSNCSNKKQRPCVLEQILNGNGKRRRLLDDGSTRSRKRQRLETPTYESISRGLHPDSQDATSNVVSSQNKDVTKMYELNISLVKEFYENCIHLGTSKQVEEAYTSSVEEESDVIPQTQGQSKDEGSCRGTSDEGSLRETSDEASHRETSDDGNVSDNIASMVQEFYEECKRSKTRNEVVSEYAISWKDFDSIEYYTSPNVRIGEVHASSTKLDTSDYIFSSRCRNDLGLIQSSTAATSTTSNANKQVYHKIELDNDYPCSRSSSTTKLDNEFIFSTLSTLSMQERETIDNLVACFGF